MGHSVHKEKRMNGSYSIVPVGKIESGRGKTAVRVSPDCVPALEKLVASLRKAE